MLDDLTGVVNLLRKLSENYRKDSTERKTKVYLHKRLELLRSYRDEFDNLAEQLPVEQTKELQQEAEQYYSNVFTDIQKRLQNLQLSDTPETSSSVVRDSSPIRVNEKEDPKSTTTQSKPAAVPEPIDIISVNTPIKEESQSVPATEASSTTTVSAGNSADNSSKYSSKNNTKIMSTLSIPEALRLIPEYDGSASELHHFINACDTVQSLIATENVPNFFKILKLKLKGKAYDIIKYDDIKDFSSLKAKLTMQFLETRTLETIQVELVSAKQKHNETETEFTNRVERLLSDLNAACITSDTAETISKPIRDLNARTALRAFQEGLREPIKLLVKASRYTTLKAASDAAISEGKQYPLQRQNNTTNNSTSSKFSSKFCTHCRKNGHTFDECRNKLKCSQCNRFGHSVSQCREKVQQNSNQPKAQVTVVTCKYCKNAGHTIEQCRKLEYNRKNNVNSGNSKSPTTRATVAATESTPTPAQQ